MQIERASRFLQNHSLKKNSFARSCCLTLLDLALVAGFSSILWQVIQDQDYWRKAPYPLHVFIIVQYALLALLIRVPIMKCRAATTGWVVCCISLSVKVNAIIGLYFIHSMTSLNEDQTESGPEFEL